MPDHLEDPLNALFATVRAATSVYSRNELRGPWGIRFPPSEHAAFHFVAQGTCWLRTQRRKYQMEAGDLALVPRGVGHVISDVLGGPATDYDQLPTQLTGKGGVLRFGGTGAPVLLYCGALVFSPPEHPMIAVLPEVLLAGERHAAGEDPVPSVIRAMELEAARRQPGSDALLARLAEVVALQAIRAWFARQEETAEPLSRALRDKGVGRAIASMHHDVRRPWTTGALATTAHMSRAAFARRFEELVGEGPIEYLRRWRMSLASHWLRTEQLGLGEIAERLGYGSDSAFSRAFKRQRGIAPNVYRQQRLAAAPVLRAG